MYSLNVPYFNLDHIYKSGQVFTWRKIIDGKYVVKWRDKAVKVQQRKEHLFFNCTEDEFFNIWWDYFDFGTDYSIINNMYKGISEDIASRMVRCNGLHIVRQDLFEVIIFSMLETATSIERVKQMIDGICKKCGKKHVNSMGEIGVVKWYEFPTPQQILKNKHKLTTEDIGYKMEVIENICQSIIDGWLDFDVLRVLDTEDAIEYLMEFKGIGRKVAESICLYGMHRMECFPIDTHINQYFKKEYNMKPEDWLYENTYNEKYRGYLRQSIFYTEINPPIKYESINKKHKENKK